MDQKVGLDPREPHLEWLMECSWSYWSYTREILKRLYGSNPWDYCALSNIIKCTNVYGSGQDSTIDKTSYNMAKSCILDLGVIFKEIEVLEPNHIIFYTYNFHKEMLINLPFANSICEKTTIEHKVLCGQKKLGWWERHITTSWNDNVKLLVVGHPERMKKEEYISLIIDWVKSINYRKLSKAGFTRNPMNI